MFPKGILENYRQRVIHSKYGKELKAAISSIEKKNCYEISGEKYKKVPRGYDAGHENADLLKYKGLFAQIEMPVPEEFFSDEILDFCFDKFKDMSPIHKWLVNL